MRPPWRAPYSVLHPVIPSCPWETRGVNGWHLSGPVSRDTARLSQRYPPIARYGVFGVSTWPIGCDTPSPFLSVSPLESICEVEVRYPPPPQEKGYLSDTCAIPYENKANGCDTPLCDTISKRYCAIWGGCLALVGKIQRVKTQRAKTSENFAEEKNVRRRYFRRFLRSHLYWIFFIVFLDILSKSSRKIAFF